MQQPQQQIPIELREELWRRGVLSWKLRPCQKKIYDDIINNPEVIFVLNTARRFGKSTILLIIALELVLQKQDARVRYCATTLDQVSKVCSDIFPILMEDCPRAPGRARSPRICRSSPPAPDRAGGHRELPRPRVSVAMVHSKDKKGWGSPRAVPPCTRI